MTVLLILSNVDSTCLVDALYYGGVTVLTKLYDHNRKECESAIIKMIKRQISIFC